MQIRSCSQLYNCVFGREKRRFSKTVLRVEFFKKITVYRFWCGEKKIEVFAYAKERMTCKGYYRISIVLAFSCGREKTIRTRCVCVAYFFENGKNFPADSLLARHAGQVRVGQERVTKP